MPCFACQMDRFKTIFGSGDDRFEESGEVTISLELRQNELERYQQVRNHREKYGVPMFDDEDQESEEQGCVF